MKEEINLKNCPFCNGQAILFNVPRQFGFAPKKLYIQCENCKLTTPMKSIKSTLQGEISTEEFNSAMEKLVKYWNTRI